MSQKVDFSTPLTQEEYDYLTVRSQRDLIDRAHSMHGTTDEDYNGGYGHSGDGTGPQVQALNSSERAAQRREELRRELEALDAAYPADDEGDEETGTDDGDVTPYEEWPVADLDAELKRRVLSGAGNKAEKVKRLYADDEQQ